MKAIVVCSAGWIEDNGRGSTDPIDSGRARNIETFQQELKVRVLMGVASNDLIWAVYEFGHRDAVEVDPPLPRTVKNAKR